jgi:hypothetical protein
MPLFSGLPEPTVGTLGTAPKLGEGLTPTEDGIEVVGLPVCVTGDPWVDADLGATEDGIDVCGMVPYLNCEGIYVVMVEVGADIIAGSPAE